MKKIYISILIIIIITFGAFALLRSPADNSDQKIEDVDLGQTKSEDSIVYEVNQEESEVRFEIDEVLRGEDFRVVGKTNQIQAQVSISEGEISTLEISRVVVDALDLETDSTSRDGAIRNFILKSNQEENRSIILEEISVDNFSESSASFSINGNLSISGVSKDIQLDAEILELTSERLVLSVSGQVLRSDFDLLIPVVPFVASVSQTVDIRADLTFQKP